MRLRRTSRRARSSALHDAGRLFGEMADEGAAAIGVVPGDTQGISLIAAVHGDDRHRVREVRGQRRIVGFFVVANHVIHRDGARGELDDVADGERLPSHAAGISAKRNRSLAGRDNVVQQASGLRLREGDERGLLRFSGVGIDEENGFRGKRVSERIAECGAGAHDGDDSEAGERNAVPLAVSDLPGEDGILAGEADLRIGEARAGVNVGIAKFHVVSGNAVRGLGHGGDGHQNCGGEKRERLDRFHGDPPNSVLVSHSGIGSASGGRERGCVNLERR
jgi:hypothetical protein